jgi:predicted nucleic acid-binding protein
MKYVIDCSVAFKWAVAETDSDKAISLRDDYRNQVHELLAPDLFSSEIANALLVAERRGRIATGQGAALLDDFFSPSAAILASPCPALDARL